MAITPKRRDRATTIESLIAQGIKTLALPERTARACYQCGSMFEGEFLETFQTVCPSCVDSTVRLSIEETRQKAADRQNHHMAEMGLEGDLSRMTFENYDTGLQPQAYAAAREFVTNFPNTLTLGFSGNPGCGKTHAAVAILHAISSWGEDGRYVYLPRLLVDLAMAGDWQEAANRAFVPLYRTPLLVIDDVGREKYRPDSQFPAMRDALINARVNGGYPTVLTTNLGVKALEAWLGDAAASRFFSAGRVVEMVPGDVRFNLPPRHSTPPSQRDPTKACPQCRNAGWVLDGKFRAGNPDRLLKCPSCDGRGY